MKINGKKELIVILLLTFALLTIVLSCIYAIRMPYYTAIKNNVFSVNVDSTPPPVEFWVGFSGILLSFVSIVMVIVTLILQL